MIFLTSFELHGFKRVFAAMRDGQVTGDREFFDSDFVRPVSVKNPGNAAY